MICRTALLIAIALAGCKGERAPAKTEPAAGSGSAKPTTVVRRDPHSQSRPDQVSVKHLDLTLLVSFERKILTGTAKLTLERHRSDELV